MKLLYFLIKNGWIFSKLKNICFCLSKLCINKEESLNLFGGVMDKKFESMVLDKRMYYAQAETMEQGKPLVDILLNFQEVVGVIADRYAVNSDFLLNWIFDVLPMKATKNIEEVEDCEEEKGV